jgi:endonuclease YncB( thermonuclease family)
MSFKQGKARTNETSKSKRQPGQPFSQAATKHLAGLVLNKPATLQEYGHDRYGRILAVVFVNETVVVK